MADQNDPLKKAQEGFTSWKQRLGDLFSKHPAEVVVLVLLGVILGAILW